MAALEAREREEARRQAEALAKWLTDGTEPEGEDETRSMTTREVLTSSAFSVTEGSRAHDLLSVWGRAGVASFNGRESERGQELTLEGEVLTGMVGTEWTRGRVTAGVVASRSLGEGTYTLTGDVQTGTGRSNGGKVEASLIGFFPWGRVALTERLESWAMAGMGTGELEVTPRNPETDEYDPTLRADLDMRMAAGGLRGTVFEDTDGTTLKGKADAMVVETRSGRAMSEAGGRLEPAEATVTRLRVGLEASRTHRFKESRVTLVPKLEVGVRHDGGDAETGFGLDVGAGFTISDAVRGLQAEVKARGLVSHEASGFKDRGFSGSLVWQQRPGGRRGATLTLTQTVGGASSGGGEALLARATMDGLAAADDAYDDLENRRMELKVGYGFGVFEGRYTATPELGFGLSNSGRDYKVGWRLARELRSGDLGSLELSLAVTRREAANDEIGAKHEVAMQLQATF